MRAAKNSPTRDSAKGTSTTEPSIHCFPLPPSLLPFALFPLPFLLLQPSLQELPPRSPLRPLHMYTHISLGRSYSHGTSYDPVLRAKCGRTLDTNARLKIHSYLRTLWQSGSVVRHKEDRGASLLAHGNVRVQREIFFDGNETSTRRLTRLIEKINPAYKNVFTELLFYE